jgi:copper chaperone CopZ
MPCAKAVADGLRRLDGVADVEVDLQANLCTVQPAADRLPDLAGFAAAVRAAGYRPERLWIAARGAVVERDGARWLTIAGSDVTLRVVGAIGHATLSGRLVLGVEPTLTIEPPPR